MPKRSSILQQSVASIRSKKSRKSVRFKSSTDDLEIEALQSTALQRFEMLRNLEEHFKQMLAIIEEKDANMRLVAEKCKSVVENADELKSRLKLDLQLDSL
jgi:predicted  nucleic acid-binding Zn-ribbon protein